MAENSWLAEQFEENRPHLRAVAYRMLGSLSEADDAVQEVWLRLSRADARSVENLGGWMTTVVARVSLDMLRSRKSRREEPLSAFASAEPAADCAGGSDPVYEAELADAVGLALLVVLKKLAPAERVAFVLHDLFGLPFEEIAPIVERSPAAARQLASRARRRVQGEETATAPNADLARRRKVVDAFLAASRGGDFAALLTLLDPNVMFRADSAAVRMGSLAEIRGAEAVAKQFSGRAQGARPALVDGALGVVVAPNGRLMLVLSLTITDGKIAAIDVAADPERLHQMDLSVLRDAPR